MDLILSIKGFEYLFLLLFSFLLTFLLIPFVVNLGEYYGFVDKPSYRKNHIIPRVRIGGLAIFISYIFVSFVYYNFISTNSLNLGNSFLTILFIGTFASFVIGIIDDLFILQAYPRLIMLSLVAIFSWYYGFTIQIINIPFIFNTYNIPLLMSIIINIFWYVGITNSINWMDGLDGLASAIGIISLFGLMIVFFQNGKINEAEITLILIGSILGFFIQNIKAKNIFMGDGGSYLIGFNLAFLSIYAGKYNPSDHITSTHSLKLLFPFLLLALPILDMTNVIFTRIRIKKSPFSSDRLHIHHKLLDSGLSEKNTLISLILFHQWFTLLALCYLGICSNKIIILISTVTFFLTIYFSKIRGSYFREN